MGACALGVYFASQGRPRVLQYWSNARQIVIAMMLYGDDSKGAAETLEDALRYAGFTPAQIERMVWVEAEPSGERKRWLYLKQEIRLDDVSEPKVVLVSPVFASGGAPPGLSRKRIVAMTDCSVQIVADSMEVLLPNGRRVRVRDVK
jgi:hypothetical protein